MLAPLSLGSCCAGIFTGSPAALAPKLWTRTISAPPSRLLPATTAVPKQATGTTAGKRAPRGFTKPKPISPAMQELLGVPEIPRTQALKQIWAYIKQHNLQDPENKRIIVCDEKLKKIFGGRDHVGFLEISGLLNPHFGS